MSLEFLSACELARKIRDKAIGSRELTDLYIERIERFDGDLNAVVVRDFERARQAADAADEALAQGQALGPLHGVPMTIKEAYDIAGLPTTWGVPDLKDNIAKEDSETVKRFKAAGAHFMGKTNVPLQLADFQSYNEIYGTTRNPWNTERGPGGSSGGSAAALAAGFCALESGSDIGGSIRNPAHFCGVYGHKPTWNIVPQQGHSLPGMLATPDIAVVGPLARSAEDLALSLDIVSGPEPLVERGWKLELPRPRHTKLSDYRVALWPTDPMAPVATEVADRVSQVGDRLAALGAHVSDTARPDFDIASSHETYLYMLNGVMAAGLPSEVLARPPRSQHRSRDGPGGGSEARGLASLQQSARNAAHGLARFFSGLGHPTLPPDGYAGLRTRSSPHGRAHPRGERFSPALFSAALLGGPDHGGLSAQHGISHRGVPGRLAHRAPGRWGRIRRSHLYRFCSTRGR